ncbi:hypothetical protein [Mesorhizobium sp. NZP2298]|uniref:hypothetical protein n=1 Tax=Mesorhizobium sp. NZP2298 TaxID=2483403 RepID=UPI001556CF79|nr:hypothetical protein [Mesorhizobium sp. NZP2298]QKC98540.1 hypothetical protein EB231_30785 [Mesorhizobium sp. NZP2298]
MYSVAKQALILDQRFWQLTIRAERRASGALSSDGIERRLTLAAALTYHTRHLIKAAEVQKPDTTLLSAAVGANLGTLARDHVSALVQILKANRQVKAWGRLGVMQMQVGRHEDWGSHRAAMKKQT